MSIESPIAPQDFEAQLSGGVFSKKDRLSAWRRVFNVLVVRGRLFFLVLFNNIRFTHRLDKVWRERYVRAVKDLQVADAISAPSRQWSVITLFYRLILRGLGFSRFKSTMGRFLAAYEPHNPRYFDALHHVYRSVLEKRDTWGLLKILEEPLLGDGDYVMHRGRRLSLDFLQSIDEFYRLQESLGFKRDDRVVFCEIGAGYGRLADVILSAMPRATYLIFDLPESLVLSQYYLTRLHPNRRVALYPESSSVFSAKDSLLECGLVFGLPHQLKMLPKKSVDVLINIYSFMEMPRKQIAAYFDVIEDLQVGALFLKQHKHEVNLLDQSLNTHENYPIRSGWGQLYKGTSALYDDVFESIYRVSK